MYPSSSASSSSSSQPHNSSISQTGLTRYGSAPGSLLTSTVDAIIAGGGGSRIPPPGHYFSGECKDHHRSSSSYEAFDGSALVRQKSSPAGFLAHLADHNHNAGFTITTHGGGGGGGQECLSRISENPATTAAAHTQSYGGGGGGGGWGENSNSIAFSAKRSRTNNDADILHCLNALESQFSLPQTTLEMASVDHLLHIPEDSVPCKIRAKRGMATHPRSIAERERRTRISGKLKKLQDLVPNMDKCVRWLNDVSKCRCSKQVMQTCWIWPFNISKVFKVKFRSFTKNLRIALADAKKAHKLILFSEILWQCA